MIRARNRYENKKYEKAIQKAKKAVEIDTSFFKSNFQLGYIYFESPYEKTKAISRPSIYNPQSTILNLKSKILIPIAHFQNPIVLFFAYWHYRKSADLNECNILE